MAGGIEPASFFLSLSSIDDFEDTSNDDMLFATNFTSSNDAVTLKVRPPLQQKRLWNYQVLALGCRGHPVTNVFELSKCCE